MTGKQLKNSILQWAIQGKLVPQDPNDEPASVLLEKIRAEKARFIKEGKIKKDKKESIIYRGEDNSYYEKFADGKVVCIDDEIPFEIPSGWEWCRIRDISQSYIGLTYKPTDVTQTGTIVLRSSNIQEGQLDLNDIVRVSTPIPDKLWVEENDIVICARNGSKKLVGKSAIVDSLKEPMTFGAFMAICKTPIFRYVYNFLQSELFYAQLRGVSSTTTINQLTQNNFNNFLIPIPPLGEQQRIDARLQIIIPIVNKYGESQEKLDVLNNSLSNSFRKSILQEAIQGRLVPQDDSDEPSSVLLQRIKDEKLRLVKEGKLKKKDVVDSVIFKGDDNKYFEKKGKEVACIDDEIPFEIPESWQWCRINTICNITNGFTPLRTEDRFWRNGDINWFTVEDIRTQGEDINYTAQKITKEATTPDRIVRPGSTLLCCTASVGQCAFTNIPTTTNQQFNALTIKDDYRSLMTDEYLFLFAKTLKDELHRLSGKTTFEFISVKKVSNILVPIPPFNEQKRIVAIVNKSLASIMSRQAEQPYK